jgi:predicted restriction endonuclease
MPNMRFTILKRNGSKYIEAAHIIPHQKKGRATLDNIILLCPNHHKEFNLGDCKHIIHSKIDFEFSLNGTVYKLKL